MTGSPVPARELPAALGDDVDSQRSPRQVRRMVGPQHLDPPVADPELVVGHLDGTSSRPCDRVVLEQVGQGRGGRQVVHRDDVDERVAGHDGAEQGATDPAEAVDRDAGRVCHQGARPSDRRQGA